MSQDNASSLGERLRQRREELGISLEQVQADTRIRAHYLQALEAGDYAALPDAVAGRGFVRNYAAYLGLDPLELSRLYSVSGVRSEPVTVAVEDNPFTAGPFQPVPLHEMPGLRPRWTWLLPVLIVVVGAAAALAWWGYPWYSGLLPWSRTLPTATVTATAEVAAVPSATPTLTPTAPATLEPTETGAPEVATETPQPTRTLVFTPSPSPSPSPRVYTGVFVELVFTDTSWIQVSVDGVRQEQGTLPAGTHRSYYGNERIELRIGNAGAVNVTLNGQKLGTLGAPGEVVDLVFELQGDHVGAATPTAGPTVTATPRLTPPPATATPTLSPTAPVTPTAQVTDTPTP